MKRLDIYALTLIGASAVMIGGGLTFATMRSDRAVAAAAAPAPAAPAPATHLYMTIATPKMLGNEMPAYMPANFSVPANSDVVVTITNFDDATALTPGTEQYATATGIKGALSVQTMDPTNPGAVTKAASLMSMAPADVSHTLTVPQLGLNVPIAPKSVTNFTFHSGAIGTYAWQCMDPCGSDPAGWGGAMATAGYMKGGLTACGGCCC